MSQTSLRGEKLFSITIPVQQQAPATTARQQARAITVQQQAHTDLIVERANPWAELYDPARKTLGAITDFARENANVMVQYTDLATPGDVESADEIKPDTGAVVRRGLTKVAVYRHEEGALHERSAICVHLGCVVNWNAAEQTWDCPGHGSRYHRDGHIVQGPANSGLALTDG